MASDPEGAARPARDIPPRLVSLDGELLLLYEFLAQRMQLRPSPGSKRPASAAVHLDPNPLLPLAKRFLPRQSDQRRGPDYESRSRSHSLWVERDGSTWRATLKDGSTYTEFCELTPASEALARLTNDMAVATDRMAALSGSLHRLDEMSQAAQGQMAQLGKDLREMESMVARVKNDLVTRIESVAEKTILGMANKQSQLEQNTRERFKQGLDAMAKKAEADLARHMEAITARQEARMAMLQDEIGQHMDGITTEQQSRMAKMQDELADRLHDVDQGALAITAIGLLGVTGLSTAAALLFVTFGRGGSALSFSDLALAFNAAFALAIGLILMRQVRFSRVAAVFRRRPTDRRA